MWRIRCVGRTFASVPVWLAVTVQRPAQMGAQEQRGRYILTGSIARRLYNTAAPTSPPSFSLSPPLSALSNVLSTLRPGCNITHLQPCLQRLSWWRLLFIKRLEMIVDPLVICHANAARSCFLLFSTEWKGAA